jgi:tetratricopeptide (TPR) repeat protein
MGPVGPPQPPWFKGGLLLLVIGASLALLVGVLAARRWLGDRGDPPHPGPPAAAGQPDDPRLTFETPYRNVRPGVKYVGDAACAACHFSQAKTYRAHPMGRSLAPVADAAPLERYTAAVHNPFSVPGFRYQVRREGGRAWHAEAVLAGGKGVAETTAEVRWAVGSGHNGRAYLVDHEGWLFSSPVTWYSKQGIWDLSPGYEKVNPHFDRPVTPDCLFCHASHADHVPHTVNRYRQPVFRQAAIGCERCHGPGELHVRRRQQGGAAGEGLDDTIVNPARLEHSLREAVCQQCHLQGQQRVWRRGRDTFDYRPGMPFHLFMSEFVKPPGQAGGLKFVGTVEQMAASRCFQQSAGKNKLGCISCHDPHAVPAEETKADFYRGRCLKCHQDQGCSLEEAARREKQNNCTACHMPKGPSNINHAAITDHRILRRPDRSRRPDDWPVPGQMPLVHFHRELIGGEDPDVERDRAIALVELGTRLPARETGQAVMRMALPALEAALRRDEADLPAWEAKGNALWEQGRLAEALEAFETVLRAAPHREHALLQATRLALLRRRLDQARVHAERLVALAPWRWRHHHLLGQVHAQEGNWAAALEGCGKALELNPAEPSVRQFVILCRLRLGDGAQAQREFDTLLAMNPRQAGRLRRWFAEVSRQAGR